MNVKNVVPQNSMMMNIINVLNDTFVQLNVSLQNKSNISDHKLLNRSISYKKMHEFVFF